MSGVADDKDVWDYFVISYVARFPSSGLPDFANEEGQEFYAALRKAVIERGISIDDADAAADLLVLCPPQWPRDHPAAFLRAAGQVRAERERRAARESGRRLQRETEAHAAARRQRAVEWWYSLAPEEQAPLLAEVAEREPEVPPVFRRVRCIDALETELIERERKAARPEPAAAY